MARSSFIDMMTQKVCMQEEPVFLERNLINAWPIKELFGGQMSQLTINSLEHMERQKDFKMW